MKQNNNAIKQIDLSKIDVNKFPNQFVGCVILTKDKKILLQKRGDDWKNFPGYLAEFGGRIEPGETPMQALIRELNEELGANVKKSELVNFGAITELMSNHYELIHCFFWEDKSGSITGCYEGEAAYFDEVELILKQKKITDGLRWLLNECVKINLLK